LVFNATIEMMIVRKFRQELREKEAASGAMRLMRDSIHSAIILFRKRNNLFNGNSITQDCNLYVYG
ncbi:MAG: hypothetical protein ACK52F_00205, partial [bacterium]